MRFKKLASSAAILGLAAGMVVVASGVASAETATLYPYVDWSFGANSHSDTTLIGSTDPGQADGLLCLDYPATGASGQTEVTDLTTPGHYSGRVNGTVVNPPTQLDQIIVLQDLATNAPACTGNGVAFSGTASSVVDNVHHKGTDTVSLGADVQPGLLATSKTFLRVNCQTNQVVKISGATIVAVSNATNNTTSATCTSSSATVDFSLKPVAVKTKAALNTSACNDVDNVVSLNVADDALTERTNPLDNSDAAHSYSPSDAATKNLITVHECAEEQANVTGKPVATHIGVTGAGTDSVDVLYATTFAPQLWDTTRGATCTDTKATDTVGTVAYGSRVFTCKGNYGVEIAPGLPLTIFVRGIDSTNAGIDPKGLLHPQPPLLISSSVMTIS